MDFAEKFFHLARLCVEGKVDDAFLLIRRDLPQLARERPDLSSQVASLMASATSASVARQAQGAVRPAMQPLDLDSKLTLVREEPAPTVSIDPVWSNEIRASLESLVEERANLSALTAAGVRPTSTMLFVGQPGVGKTLAARWIAEKLGWRLLTLDLAAVMSSFLGRTGNNIRSVLDYARSAPSVLLLDEFDAIAKRRDDAADVGELKRLVTVLLQSVDEWPATGLLIAATNHPELLDPAVWRRFEQILEFRASGREQVAELFRRLIPGNEVDSAVTTIFSSVFAGQAPSNVVREVNSAKRDAVLRRMPLREALLSRITSYLHSASTERRVDVAENLRDYGFSQREIGAVTGLSRDTLRTRGIGVRGSRRKAG